MGEGVAVAAPGPVPPPPPSEWPSIAVLPFENLGDDGRQDHVAGGIVEEIITGFSRINGLSVIPRNSSFASRAGMIDSRSSRVSGFWVRFW